MTRMETTNDTKKTLPDGWRWVWLGEVCEIIAGQSPPGSTYRTNPEGLPFFQGKADFGLLNPVPRVWCVEPNKIALPGDILISVRAPVGPTNIADVKCCIGRGLAAIRCGGDADIEFILSALRHFESRLVGKGAGSTFEAISRDDLEQLSFPLPPLSEQRRIAAVLREQMAAVDKARAAAQARLEAVKTLPGAYLRQVFPQPGQPLPAGWRWVRLGEVCEIKGGKRLPNGTDFIEGNTQFPYIRVVDFSEGTVDTHNLKYIDAATQSMISRYIISRNDVYISIAGTIGLVGTIPDSLDGANLTENAARLLIKDKDLLHKDYLARLLMSGMGKEFIHERTNTVGQPKLALTRIATIPVPLPPLAEQRRIAGMLREQMAAVEKARAAAEEELATINALPAALLCRAFSGEI